MNECVYIILPVHNRKNTTRGFIDSLLAQTWKNYHLILIDDGSNDGTDQMVRKRIEEKKLSIIKGNGDWWWAGSLQQGVDWLKRHDINTSDVILMINDDVTFCNHFLYKAVECIRLHPDSLLLSQFYDIEKNKTVETGVKGNWKKLTFLIANSKKDINCLSTRGLFMRFYALKRIGGFHPLLLPHYGSDYEFTMRAIRKGFRALTMSDINLIPDLTTSGIREYNADSLIDEIRTMFTKGCVYNPLYWSSFIMLSCPIHYIPMNLLKIWVGAIRRLTKTIRTK